MSLFTARLHLPGQAKLPLNVEVDVNAERMLLTSGDRQIANWSLGELDIERQRDGFHVTVEDEEMVLTVTDERGFADALGVPDSTSDSQGRSSGHDAILSLDTSRLVRLRIEDLEIRIGEVGEALESEAVPPPMAFSKWLRLLKELNRLHGHGSLPANDFYGLNTRLLDLIPDSEAVI